MTLSTHLIERAVAEAEEAYQAARREYEAVAGGPLTADRLLRRIELHDALKAAAEELEESKATRNQVVERESREKRDRVKSGLTDVEAELAKQARSAETLMDALAEVLESVVDLSKKRYSLRADISGSADRRLLPAPKLAGWIQWRLGPLAPFELGRAQHHERHPLAELLHVDTIPIETGGQVPKPDPGKIEDDPELPTQSDPKEKK